MNAQGLLSRVVLESSGLVLTTAVGVVFTPAPGTRITMVYPTGDPYAERLPGMQVSSREYEVEVVRCAVRMSDRPEMDGARVLCETYVQLLSPAPRTPNVL